MVNERHSLSLLKILESMAYLVITIAGLKAAKSILAPFVFAVLVAIVAVGLVRFLRSKRVPATISYILVTCAFVASTLGIGSLVTQAVRGLLSDLPRYQEAITQAVAWANQLLSRFNFSLDKLAGSPQESLGEFLQNALQLFLGGISGVGTAIVILVFLIIESADFQEKLNHTLKNSIGSAKLRTIGYDVQRYLGVKTLTSLLTGLLIIPCCYFMGVPNSLMWGTLAFILNFIPIIGSIIAGVPAVVLTAMDQSLMIAFLLGVMYVFVNVLVSNFIEPALMGRQLGLSPLVVFLSLLFWGWLWGPIGMLVSVPITMIIKIFLENSSDFAWLGILMSSRKALDHSVAQSSENKDNKEGPLDELVAIITEGTKEEKEEG